jgi:hypothetical protein
MCIGVTRVIYDVPAGGEKGFLTDSAAAHALPGGWRLGSIFATEPRLAFTPGVTRDI